MEPLRWPFGRMAKKLARMGEIVKRLRQGWIAMSDESLNVEIWSLFLRLI
jgi:hypothetical protein